MPIRTCVGCGIRKSSDLMVRLCIDNSKVIHLSRASNGRGAWICRNSECIALAVRKGKIERALRIGSSYGFDKQLSSIGETLGYLG